jgi:hypothetical protein
MHNGAIQPRPTKDTVMNNETAGRLAVYRALLLVASNMLEMEAEKHEESGSAQRRVWAKIDRELVADIKAALAK